MSIRNCRVREYESDSDEEESSSSQNSDTSYQPYLVESTVTEIANHFQLHTDCSGSTTQNATIQAFYKEVMENGGYDDKIYTLDDPSIIYAAMEILIEWKLTDLMNKDKGDQDEHGTRATKRTEREFNAMITGFNKFTTDIDVGSTDITTDISALIREASGFVEESKQHSDARQMMIYNPTYSSSLIDELIQYVVRLMRIDLTVIIKQFFSNFTRNHTVWFQFNATHQLIRYRRHYIGLQLFALLISYYRFWVNDTRQTSNYQITEQTSDIQSNIADQFEAVCVTWRFSKRPPLQCVSERFGSEYPLLTPSELVAATPDDGSDGITFLTNAYDGAQITRSFINESYATEITPLSNLLLLFRY